MNTRVKTPTIIHICICMILLFFFQACSEKNPCPKAEKEGDKCCSDAQCPDQLMCDNNICRRICTIDKDCAKTQICEGNFCQDVKNPLCVDDNECQAPGRCELLREAYCEGAKCHYKAKKNGETCNDDDVCTENDACSDGKCVGQAVVCTTPDGDSYCSDDDATYNTFILPGTCETANNIGCIYERTSYPCENCKASCEGFCDGVVCPQISNSCLINVCDPKSPDDPPCSPINKDEGTPCSIVTDSSTDAGYCGNGNCVECTKDEHCTHYPSFWESCYIAKCENYSCVYSFNSEATCSKRCLDGIQYGTGDCVLLDALDITSATCNGNQKSCNGYECLDDHSACRIDCADDAHCMPTHYCHGDECALKIVDGSSCDLKYENRDCASGYCDSSTDGPALGLCCRPADTNDCCQKDEDCPSGKLCRNSTAQCLNGEIGSPCDDHEDCHEDGYCKAEKCTERLENGADGCSDNAMCISNHCDSSQEGPETGRCCARNECCNEKSDCPENHVCKDYVCTSEAEGQPCNNDDDCNSSTYCAGGTCTTLLSKGETCTGDNQCATKHCTDDVCCNEECKQDGYSCSQNGDCLKDAGQSCAVDDDCLSEHCVDNTCCQVASCGICEACNISSDGTCAKVADGQNDDTCLESEYKKCNREGKCLLIDGKNCTKNSECYSENCVDDVCCFNRECDTCQACNIEGHQGSCFFVEYGHNGRACKEAYKQCDGAGGCKSILGEMCRKADDCLLPYCVDSVCCEKEACGECEQCNVYGSCTPIGRGLNDTDICSDSTIETCDGAGHCVKKDGQQCNANTECFSGNCVDGVCCNEPCEAPDVCENSTVTYFACNVPGSIGTCTEKEKSCGAMGCNGNACFGSCTRDAECNTGYYCTEGSCEAKKINGNTCTAANQCQSNNCVDNVCCSSDSCGTCEACNIEGHQGSCFFVALNAQDDTCKNNGKVCDGSGHCDLINGQNCTDNSQCLSNNCVDGACCASASCGTCETCASGSCQLITAGLQDNDTCSAEGEVCDGEGHCEHINGEHCTSGDTCYSGNCVDNTCCASSKCAEDSCIGSTLTTYNCSSGSCSPVSDICPNNLKCNDAKTACLQKCRKNSDCMDGYCNAAGECSAKQNNGAQCNASILMDSSDSLSSICSSSSCVDGVCCASAYCGTCQAWNLNNSGTCSFVTADFQDDTCQENGKVCDGQGHCNKSNGQVCAVNGDCVSGHCVDGVCCDTSCDGSCMACNVPSHVGTCYAVISASDDTCKGTKQCNEAGTCVNLNGQTCSQSSDCLTKHCIDGVCCNSVCSGTCQACNVTGSVGTCANVLSGEMDTPTCPPSGLSNYVCDGTGNCDKVSGQVCSQNGECLTEYCVDNHCCTSSSCPSDTCTANKLTHYSCGTSGNCTPTTTTCPGNLQCNDAHTACLTACSKNSDCVSGYCNNSGVCTAKRTNGEVCNQGFLKSSSDTPASSCESGFCADGVCCNNACNGTCQSCVLASLQGTCSTVKEATDDTCNGTKKCDSSGTCDLIDGQGCSSGTECYSTYCVDDHCCSTASCTNQCTGNSLTVYTCGNSGQCTAAMPVTCDGHLNCEDASKCRTSCSSDSHCISGYYCNSGSCVPKNNTGSCTADNQCSTGHCLDGVCCNSASCGNCEACNVPGHEGSCYNVAAGEQDDTCRQTGKVCDGNGECVRINGQVCAIDSDCFTGNCIDNVCCDTRCSDTCKSCSISGHVGTC